MSIFSALPPGSQAWLISNGMHVGRLARGGDYDARLIVAAYARAQSTEALDDLWRVVQAIRAMQKKRKFAIDNHGVSGHVTTAAGVTGLGWAERHGRRAGWGAGAAITGGNMYNAFESDEERKKFRRETAARVLAGLLSDPSRDGTPREYATWAVAQANYLIAALDAEPEGS